MAKWWNMSIHEPRGRSREGPANSAEPAVVHQCQVAPLVGVSAVVIGSSSRVRGTVSMRGYGMPMVRLHRTGPYLRVASASSRGQRSLRLRADRGTPHDAAPSDVPRMRPPRPGLAPSCRPLPVVCRGDP